MLSPRTIPLSALAGAAALITRLVSGHGLPGAGGAALELAAALLLPAALVTEVVKITKNLQGGEM